MSTFVAEHQTVLKDVRRHFVLPADSSVATFLTAHPALAQILLEAAPQLRAAFGAETLVNLRVPIDDSGSQSLYAVVMWPGQVRDVRDDLARFDDAWWIARSRQASGYLTFTYELV